MNDEFVILAARIRSELPEIERLVRRVNDGWQRAAQTGDDLYLDGVALNLHGFYNALEKIFERIADATGESVPDGANWHQGLLQQMSAEVAGIRPAVISEPIKIQLGNVALTYCRRKKFLFSKLVSRIEEVKYVVWSADFPKYLEDYSRMQPREGQSMGPINIFRL